MDYVLGICTAGNFPKTLYFFNSEKLPSFEYYAISITLRDFYKLDQQEKKMKFRF